MASRHSSSNRSNNRSRGRGRGSGRGQSWRGRGFVLGGTAQPEFSLVSIFDPYVASQLPLQNDYYNPQISEEMQAQFFEQILNSSLFNSIVYPEPSGYTSETGPTGFVGSSTPLNIMSGFAQLLASLPAPNELDMEMALAASQALPDTSLEPKNITLNVLSVRYSEFMNSNPLGESSNHADVTTCGICLETYTSDDMVVKLPECPHVYHELCICIWGRAKPECPMCKTVIPHVFEESIRDGMMNGGEREYSWPPPPDLDLSVGYPHLAATGPNESNISIQDNMHVEESEERCERCDGIINFECTCNSSASEYMCGDCNKSRENCDCVI